MAMATVHSYEKPGCINNTRQKQLLIEAGYTLVIYDLLQQPWAEQAGKLRSFFGNLPIAEWFNPSAPAIKTGLFNPAICNEQQALTAMIAQPLLIRRPLLEMAGERRVGFASETIQPWLGLTPQAANSNLETCRQQT